MNCPTDGTTLLMSERQGVEIDYCPQCRGIWLDRGELDKILERAKSEFEPAAPSTPAATAESARQYEQPRYDDRGHDSRGYDSRGHGDPRRRKKESPFEFLGDLFG